MGVTGGENHNRGDRDRDSSRENDPSGSEHSGSKLASTSAAMTGVRGQ
jgi:hypothetical protein